MHFGKEALTVNIYSFIGFLPPGPPPPITPPVSVPHTPVVNIPNCKCSDLGQQ